jgi:hypothetical protein
VYTAGWFRTPRLGAAEWVDDYDLWVAHYYWLEVTSTTVPARWMNWKIWQHSNKGTVPGISGNGDLNWFWEDDGGAGGVRGWVTPAPAASDAGEAGREPGVVGGRAGRLGANAGLRQSWAKGLSRAGGQDRLVGHFTASSHPRTQPRCEPVRLPRQGR